MLDSPWTHSMPSLFFHPDHLLSPSYRNEQSFDSLPSDRDSFMNSLATLDLSNPFNTIASVTPDTSVWSGESFDYHHQNRIDEHRHEFRSSSFEPLPFLSAEDSRQPLIHPHLSQKHAIIQQSRACRPNSFSLVKTLFSFINRSDFTESKRKPHCSFTRQSS